MRYTRENIWDGIEAKLSLFRDGNESTERYLAICREFMQDYPKELEQNVLEWVNNEPITEIDCHGASIKGVMCAEKLSDLYFPMVVRNFKIYRDRNFKGGNYICYKMF